MKITKKDNIITCPRCGYQYLPGELYLPNHFLGQPKDIIREDNVIKYYDGVAQDVYTHYLCDKCDAPLVIKCNMTFKVDIDERFDFDQEHTTEISTGITLPEE